MSTPSGPQYADPAHQVEPPKKKNWFLRHKILTALLALVVLVIAISVGGGGSKKSSGDSSSATSSAPSSSSGGSASSSAATKALAAVGTPVRDGKFEFTVTKVVRGQKTVGAQYVEEKAQGEFTLVYLTVKNIGTDQQGFSDSDQKAVDSEGTQYAANSAADASIEGNSVLFTQINPGNQVKGVLAFDAPAGKKLTKIQLHDSMFSGGVDAAL